MVASNPYYRNNRQNFYSEKSSDCVSVGTIINVFKTKSNKKSFDSEFIPVSVPVNGTTAYKLKSGDAQPETNPEYQYNGYLYCDGSEYDIKDYPLLYSVIGNDYGGSSSNGITVLDEGNNYSSGTQILFSTAPDGGLTAAGIVVVNAGKITRIIVTEPGIGYTSPPTITLTNTGGGTGAIFNVRINKFGSISPITKENVFEFWPEENMGTFKVPDLLAKKIVGYGPVYGSGTPTIGNIEMTIGLNSIGGTWYLDEESQKGQFNLGQVTTTGYTNAIDTLSGDIVGSQTITVTLQEKRLPGPPQHSHLLLNSECPQTQGLKPGAVYDSYLTGYKTGSGKIEGFTPSGGIALTHSHGLLRKPLLSNELATYDLFNYTGGDTGLGTYKTNGNVYASGESGTFEVLSFTPNPSFKVFVNTSQIGGRIIVTEGSPIYNYVTTTYDVPGTYTFNINTSADELTFTVQGGGGSGAVYDRVGNNGQNSTVTFGTGQIVVTGGGGDGGGAASFDTGGNGGITGTNSVSGFLSSEFNIQSNISGNNVGFNGGPGGFGPFWKGVFPDENPNGSWGGFEGSLNGSPGKYLTVTDVVQLPKLSFEFPNSGNITVVPSNPNFLLTNVTVELFGARGGGGSRTISQTSAALGGTIYHPNEDIYYINSNYGSPQLWWQIYTPQGYNLGVLGYWYGGGTGYNIWLGEGGYGPVDPDNPYWYLEYGGYFFTFGDAYRGGPYARWWSNIYTRGNCNNGGGSKYMKLSVKDPGIFANSILGCYPGQAGGQYPDSADSTYGTGTEFIPSSGYITTYQPITNNSTAFGVLDYRNPDLFANVTLGGWVTTANWSIEYDLYWLVTRNESGVPIQWTLFRYTGLEIGEPPRPQFIIVATIFDGNDPIYYESSISRVISGSILGEQPTSTVQLDPLTAGGEYYTAYKQDYAPVNNTTPIVLWWIPPAGGGPGPVLYVFTSITPPYWNNGVLQVPDGPTGQGGTAQVLAVGSNPVNVEQYRFSIGTFVGQSVNNPGGDYGNVYLANADLIVNTPLPPVAVPGLLPNGGTGGNGYVIRDGGGGGAATVVASFLGSSRNIVASVGGGGGGAGGSEGTCGSGGVGNSSFPDVVPVSGALNLFAGSPGSVGPIGGGGGGGYAYSSSNDNGGAPNAGGQAGLSCYNSTIFDLISTGDNNTTTQGKIIVSLTEDRGYWTSGGGGGGSGGTIIGSVSSSTLLANGISSATIVVGGGASGVTRSILNSNSVTSSSAESGLVKVRAAVIAGYQGGTTNTSIGDIIASASSGPQIVNSGDGIGISGGFKLPLTQAPTIVIIPQGDGPGSGATATATVSNGVITGINLVSSGSNYESAPKVRFLHGVGAGTVGSASVSNGSVTNVSFQPGTGGAYTKYVRMGGTELQRYIVLKQFDCTTVEKIGVKAARGNGINGGDRPDDSADELRVYYNTDGSDNFPDNQFIGVLVPRPTDAEIASNYDGTSGDTKWYTYTIPIPEGAQTAGVKFKILQNRSAASGANDNGGDTDHFGICEFFYDYKLVSETNFVPTPGELSSSASSVSYTIEGSSNSPYPAGMAVNDITFNLTAGVPLLPVPFLDPTRDIPLVEPYMLSKYLIKAY